MRNKSARIFLLCVLLSVTALSVTAQNKNTTPKAPKSKMEVNQKAKTKVQTSKTGVNQKAKTKVQTSKTGVNQKAKTKPSKTETSSKVKAKTQTSKTETNQKVKTKTQTSKTETDPKAAAKVQTATVKINTKGYQPASLKLKRGIPARITFLRTTDATCAKDVVLPAYRIARELPLNKEIVVSFTPKKAGEFNFSCGMDMMRGKIIVQ